MVEEPEKWSEGSGLGAVSLNGGVSGNGGPSLWGGVRYPHECVRKGEKEWYREKLSFPSLCR